MSGPVNILTAMAYIRWNVIERDLTRLTELGQIGEDELLRFKKYKKRLDYYMTNGEFGLDDTISEDTLFSGLIHFAQIASKKGE